MAKNSSKKIAIVIIVVLIICLGAWITSFVDKKFPGIGTFPKYKDIYIDDMRVDKNEVVAGETLTASISVYNNSDKEKELSVGMFAIRSDQVYDGSNIDYASQKQQYKIASKTSKKSEWKVPVNWEKGSYRILFWLHQIDDGAEKVLEDSWYPKIISVSGAKDSNIIRGEESNADQGLVLSQLLISPINITSNGLLSIDYTITNHDQTASKIETGVFLINKNKLYQGDNVDQVIGKKSSTIKAGQFKNFSDKEQIHLNPGEYKILIWLHRLNGDKSEVVFDYWAPGNIIVGDVINGG